MADSNYWKQRAVTRRRFLLGSAAAGMGLAGAALIGCGDDDEATATPAAAGTATVTTSLTATEPAAAGPKYGGQLVVAWGTQPGFLNAHASTGGQDVTFLRALYDNIAKRDDTGAPNPEWSIAETWDIEDEGKSIVFHIRPGVKFHDGTDCDAEAVTWNFDNFFDPDNNSPEKANLQAMNPEEGGSWEVVDSRTVRVRLSRPSASVLNMLGDRGGMLISPTTYESKGKEAFRRDPVATGPFKFAEWVQDDHITLVRNENYWRKDENGNQLPYIDEIRWNFISESAVHLANLESGAAQMAGVSASDLERIRNNPNLKVQDFTGGAIVNFYVNTTFGAWAKPENRLAFAYAIDRNSIVDGLLLGNGQVAVGPISPAFGWAFEPDPAKVSAPLYDLDRARELLREAGNPDGYEIPLVGGRSSSNIERAEAIQAMVGQMGIEFTYEPLDVSTYVQRTMVDKDVAGQMSGIVLRGDPNAVSQVFHSDGFYNPGHLKDEVGLMIDDLLTKADSTFDLEERKHWYTELTKVINEDARSIFLYYSRANRAMHQSVNGWSFGSEGNGRWDTTWIDA